MINIKNFTIFKCSINKSFHWSKLPKLKQLMYRERFNLRYADLRSANLSYADLRYADLSSAILKPIDNKDVIIEDFMSVCGLGSQNRQTLIFKTNIGIVLLCGCFYGTEKDFKKKVKETHAGTNYEKEYLELLKLAKIRFSRGKKE